MIQRGIADLNAGHETIEALLVSIGATRLRSLGIELSSPIASPEHKLYLLLAHEKGQCRSFRLQRPSSSARQFRANGPVRELADSTRIEQSHCTRDGRNEVPSSARREIFRSITSIRSPRPSQRPSAAMSKTLCDVKEMIASGLIDPAAARAQFESIESELYRFPAIDPDSFRRSVEQLFK